MINNKDVVFCQVCGISKYGFFVNIQNKYSGLVHISEISNEFVNNIEDYVKVGDYIFCEVIEVMPNNKLRLSIKNINYKLIDRYDDDRFKDAGFKNLKANLPLWIKEKLNSK